MGWASGSAFGVDFYDEIREYLPEDKREQIAKTLYDMLCDLDADAWEGDSNLEIDAKIPQYCWDCDEEFQADELENGLCKNCKDKE